MSIGNGGKPLVSRRNFIQKAVVGAGAAALGAGAKGALAADASTDARPIRVPDEFAAARNAPPQKVDFPMTGAQIFARACKQEGVAALFCCPGNYNVIHAVAATGIPVFGGRHEGSMAHAADAFIRITGEIAMCSGTEGPGFTDMICAIACANAARTPLLFTASNMAIFQEDTEAGIQLGYQQPTTEGLRKYGKRLITPARVHEYAGYAFRQLRSGVPRPVHLDFPAEISSAKFNDASDLTYYYDKAKYRTESRPFPSPKDISTVVSMIQASSRPMIVSSNGVFYSKAWEPLKLLAEKAQIPVVESGAMKGQFSDASPLSANASPGALASADLVLLVGQHCMPTVGEFAFGPDAKYIRIDQSHEDIGRNLPIDLGIVSDEKAALEALADAVPKMKHDTWIAEIAAARKKFEDQNAAYYKIGMSYSDAVHPAVIAKELSNFLYNGKLPRSDDDLLGRLRDCTLHASMVSWLPSRPDHERRLPVRRHRSRRWLRRGRRGSRAAGRRSASGIQGASNYFRHRRRRIRIHGDGNRDDVEMAPPRRCHRLQQQRLGYMDIGGAHAEGPADPFVPGEPAI